MHSSLRRTIRRLGSFCCRLHNRTSATNTTPGLWPSFDAGLRPQTHCVGYCTVVNSHQPDVDVDAVADVPLPHYVINEFRKYHKQTALVDGLTGRSLTYGQLETLVARVTTSLVKHQLVTKASHVTIFSPNSIEFVVMYLAVTSAGGVVSPVSPVYTVNELVHSINLIESTLLITADILLSTAKQAKLECPSVKNVIVLGDDANDITGCRPYSSLITDDMTLFDDNDNINNINTRSDLATLPFSSGTTGLPKAVMLTHRNVISQIVQTNCPSVLNFSPGLESVPAVLPFFHIYGQATVMLHGLTSGAKLIIFPKFEQKSYLESITKHRATNLYLVPPILLFLSQHPLVEQCDFSSVHTIISGAAPVGPETITRTVERCRNPRLEIRQAYGLTETCSISHCHPPRGAKLYTVGPVIPNAEFKIVDVETGKSLGVGQNGEVCIRSPQIMKGYYKNQRATDDAIRDGWFYTGDVGHFDEEDYLVIEDRLKELIKVKGYQVAPAELEATLVSHAAVQDAAVIGRPDERAGELPTAFIVLKAGQVAKEAELQAFVAARLAPYKQLTGGVLFCREIPKSASGKILRRQLRDELKRSA